MPSAPSRTAEPPAEDDFCAAAADLVAATNTTATKTTPDTIHSGLQKLQQLYQHLSRTSTPSIGSQDWAKVVTAYTKTLNRFDEQQRSTADDQFIYLLAEAVQRQNDAVRHWRAAVQERCGVDLAPLYVSGPR